MSDASILGSVPLGGRPPQTTNPPVRLGEVAQDPFCKLIDLPSGGLFYASGLSQVRIRPTRGEQEEMLAGTPEESPDRVRAIREVVRQCTDLQGMPFSELLVLDFGFITLHLFALSAGTDDVSIRAGCEKADCPMAQKQLSLTTLPCVHLRAGSPGESALDAPAAADPDLAAARMVEEAMGEAQEASGPEYRKVTAEFVREPFRVQLPGGVTIDWRMHRMKDLEAAEEYARATGDTSMAIGAKLGSFLSARQIVAINGEQVGTVQALQWWKQAPSPILRELREHIGQRDFGFNMRPEFRCSRGDCRKKVRVRLPNDGSLFRAGA